MKFLRLLALLVISAASWPLFGQITCDFTYQSSTTIRCAPYLLIASANNTSSSPIAERRWTLTGPRSTTVGGGQLNPSFSFVIDTVGQHCLTLWARNQNGDTCSITKCFVIAGKPVIDYTFSQTEGCQGTCVQAVCNSTGGSGGCNIDSIVIDWRCGSLTRDSICRATPISHCYNCPPGLYDIQVVVFNDCGCFKDSIFNDVVNIIPRPIARFSADTTTANCTSSPLNVNFTANNAGPNMTYCWYIDNVLQQCSTSRNFTHLFPINNVNCYDVELVVSHPSGCADSLTWRDSICVRSSPQITFTANDDTACVPFTLNLTNTTPGLPSVNWTLNGPGGPYTASGNAASFSLTQAGTYSATATGTFAPGCSATTTRQVLVLNPTPVANFTANDRYSCTSSLTVAYSATPCPNCRFVWSLPGAFPNNPFGPNPNVTVTYSSFGTFTSTLTVRDTVTGCQSVLSQPGYIVLQEINPRFSQNRVAGCSPVCATFDDITDYSSIPDSITSRCWSFIGPGVVPGGCGDTISRCFVTPGRYDIRLIVTTATGCRDTLTLNDTIRVGTPPSCTITGIPDTVCFEHEPVVFSMNCDSPSCVTAIWGDGDVTTECDPVFEHFYQDTGNITTFFIPVRDSCEADTIVFQVRINPPYARFSTFTSCQMGDTVCLINESGGATHFRWYFCNGDSSTDQNPCLVLPPCDTCAVSLLAFNTSYPECFHQYNSTINTSCGVASISPTAANVCASRIVATASTTFNNTSTSRAMPDQTRWDFDIAVPPGGPIFNQSGVTVTPFYNAPGQYTLAMENTSASGCKDTIFANVKVCKPIANFTNNNACFPDSICFTDRSVDQLCNITFRRWDFGDGTRDTVSVNPCHRYALPGVYTAKLFIRNDMGCRDSITQQIVVSDSVDLSYSVDTLICPGVTNCVTNNSTGILLTYRWDIPNALPYDTFGVAPCFTINTPGDYWIRVSISSNNLCTTRDSVFVRVHRPIASGYISEDSLLCPNPPEVIQFTSTSQYWDSLAIWNFGDYFDPTAQGEIVAHIYSYPGVYPICLTVVTRDGCVDSACIDTIVVDGPYGIFDLNPDSAVCACQDSVYYTVSTVNATSMTLLYGCSEQPIENINPISPIGSVTNPTVYTFSHYFCRLDSCQPQLIFGDDDGCVVYYAREYLYIDSPVVNFVYDNYGACLDGTVCFFDSTRYHIAGHSYTTRWLWDFGDNQTDTVRNPCHTYAAPGTYNVKLFITSNGGCVDSMVTMTVLIPIFPNAGYYADDDTLCANTSVCFHDTSTTDPLTGIAFRVWDFGDNTVDTTYVPDVCHLYATGGSYRVTLCIYDSLGCPDCDSSTVIQVIDNPVADAGPDQTVCYGAVVNLNGTGGVACQWLPASLVSNPNICNPTTQLYSDTSLILIVSDQYQCVDSDTLVMSVAQVFAGFAAANAACLSDSVCVTDTSTSVHGTLVTWTYDFGQGLPVNGPNACYLYSAPGTYTITEVVTDSNGCSDTATQVITINPNPNAAFALSDSVICSNQPLCVNDASTGTPPLTWDWNFGFSPGGGASGSNPPCILYPAPYQSSYNVVLAVTDANNCRDTAVHTVVVQEAPTANFSWNPSCEIDPMTLASTSTPGDAALNGCQWTLWLGAPNPTIDTNCNTSFVFPAGTHDVQLIVTDLNGCADTIVKTVLTDSLPFLQILGGDTTICLGTSVDYTVTGEFNNVNWTPAIWIDDPTSPTVTITPLGNVSYMVSSNNGACGPVTDTVTIRVIQPIPIDLAANPTQIVLGLSSQITSQIPGQIDSIIWSPEATLDCRDCFNPLATPTQTTTYTATIYYSQDGVTCTNSDSITINFLNSCDDLPPYLPNTFTPNGDGMNDVFMMRGIAGKTVKYFRIFDRWGKLVFESTNGQLNDPRWGWDGTDRNGAKLNPAVFVYTYEIECLNGDTNTGKGNVSLVR